MGLAGGIGEGVLTQPLLPPGGGVCKERGVAWHRGAWPVTGRKWVCPEQDGGGGAEVAVPRPSWPQRGGSGCAPSKMAPAEVAPPQARWRSQRGGSGTAPSKMAPNRAEVEMPRDTWRGRAGLGVGAEVALPRGCGRCGVGGGDGGEEGVR